MFRELLLRPMYASDKVDISKEFYNPVLANAVKFDRTSAYFSAKALASYAEGLENFNRNGNKYRLIVSHNISKEDYDAIKSGYALRDDITQEMLGLLKENLSLREEMNISNLAYFIANGMLEIKIAFKTNGIFHDKCGIAVDAQDDVICFRGSNNETQAAIDYNYESFQLICSWLDRDGFYLAGIKDSQEEFETLWNNKKEGLVVMPAQEVIINEIIKYDKGRVVVEQHLLESDTLTLDYDEQLVLTINTPSIDWFLNKVFYKMSLKHKVERIENKIMYFLPDLVYTDYIKIHELLSRKIAETDYNYKATERLLNYIEMRNLYIEKRAKLGIELKTDPANLEDKYQEFKRIVDNSFERKLREKQMRDAFFMCAMYKSGNFSVPGSGKTSSALAVFSYLKYRGLVDKILVISPKNAFGSWMEEFRSCFGTKLRLNCFNIQSDVFGGLRSKKEALKYGSANCNLFLFNFESIVNYVDELKVLVSSNTLLVIDEVHKVKAINGQRAVATLEVAKSAVYTIAMTGTPIPNSYLDLYNLLHILYNDEYKEFFGFDIGYLRNPFPSDMEYINEKIQPFFCRTTKKELKVPDANEDIIDRVYFTEDENKLFRILQSKYKKNKLALFIRLLQLESNPKMLLESINLKDFCDILETEGDIDDIDFVDYALEVKNLINNMSITSKKKACIEQVKSLVQQGKTVIVWCIFIDSILGIQKSLSQMGIRTKYIMGNTSFEDRMQIIDEFRHGQFDVLITNPHTLAESVSLHSVCHDAIYFEYSYNLVHLLQSKDRIHRLGLPDGQYTQYYYMQSVVKTDNDMEYSIDEEIYNRLMHKEQVMLKAISNNELEPVYTSEEDLRIIFKKLFDRL